MIDGVITGGTAYPQQYGNQTVQVPTITAYGVTNDGYSFFIDEQGIGNPQEQITRIVSCYLVFLRSLRDYIADCGVLEQVLEIGGPYRKLTERFILAAVQANMDRTGVVVQAFTVGQAYRAGQ